MLGLEEKDVVLMQYDYKRWDEQFVRERNRLYSLLDEQDVVIEHVGSTAIPEIPAKPIIDIAIGLKNIEDEIEACKEILISNGYIYKPQNGGDGRLFFMRVIDSRRTHHIHIEAYESVSWNNHIVFRDRLRASPTLRKKYSDLKRVLAAQYPHDRKTYTEKKAEFIQGVLSDSVLF